ncbi:MAG: PAS domain-containing protein, partial [Patescibacteria group bacterium]
MRGLKDFVKGFWTSSPVMDEIFGIDDKYERTVPGWLNIIHPDDREMMAKYLTDEVLGKGKPFNKEYRIQRIADGQVRWVLGMGKVSKDKKGRVISLIGTIQDISERKTIDIALKESEEKYRKLFENMLEGFARHKIVLDSGGQPVDYIFLEVNPVFLKMLGLDKLGHTSENISGKTLKELFPGIEDKWVKIYGAIALWGKPLSTEE